MKRYTPIYGALLGLTAFLGSVAWWWYQHVEDTTETTEPTGIPEQ